MLRKQIRRTMFFIVITICSIGKVKAQPPLNPIHEIDSQLRVMFSPLCRPTPSPNFLYEMACRTLDSIYYTDNNPDTIQRDAWYKVYEEMRNGAYDTTTLVTHDSIFRKSVGFYPDTVVMDMLAYDYYRFNDSALSCDFYFNFDTVTNEITEKGFPCEQNPYVISRVFASSPVLYNLPYKDVTFRIDSNFIYHDQWNNFVTNNWDIRIDFGDGTGWHMFNPATVTHHAVSYSTWGVKYIKTEVLDMGMPIMSSLAEVFVPDRPKPEEPQQKISLPDVTVGIYNPCNESGEPLKKVIIVVEGYDPGEMLVFNALGSRTIPDIYYDMVAIPGLEYLRNFGYTFAVVNWHNSRQDMRLNAAALEGVIDYFKCQQVTVADTGTHEQFVIIAESMGGLVARHAMCDMEQNWQTLGGCLPEKMHNTRLLITYDSPHTGVNIPLAFQHTYRDLGQFALGASSITQAIAGAMTNLYLDAKSVKQMLLYHVDTWNPITHEYSEHIDKSIFDASLSALGNYPQYCKMLAMSNGNMAGHGQTRVYDGAERTPNDHFIHYTTDLYAKVFGDEFKLYGTDYELKTTPNGNANIATLRADYYRPVIKTFVKLIPRWPWPPKVFIKLTVSSAFVTSLSYNHHGNNVKPYDVVPGSTEDQNTKLYNGKGSVSALAYNLFFGFKSPEYDSATHTFKVHKNAGTGGLWGNLYASMYSDGMNFCFVPTFSALDYSMPGNDYWHDITSNGAGTNMSRTPFNIITGILKDDNSPLLRTFRYSEQHVHTRNEDLGSFLGGVRVADTPPNRYVRYDSCQDNPNPPVVHFLNREIGDDTLLVENRTTQWTCIYDAEKYIGVNQRSPYYAYPTATGSNRIIPGIYSDENPYTIGSGTTYFKSRGAAVGIVGTLSGDYVLDTIAWIKCCGNFGPGSKQGTTNEEQPKKSIFKREVGKFLIVPNPVTNNEMMLIFPAQEDANTLAIIYDLTGKKISEHTFSVAQNEGEYRYRLTINGGGLSSGTYFVVLKNGTLTHRKTFVVDNNQ